MSNPNALTEAIIVWAATRSDEVVFDPKSAYYSFEIVADAFEKGKEFGKKEINERLRQIYFKNAQTGVEALNKILDNLKENNCVPSKIFVKNSIQGVTILLSLNPKVYEQEKDIDFAYNVSATLQSEYHKTNFNLIISFINETPNFNFNLLKSDGYGLAYDIEKDVQIY
ncbi:MAG: hypothetical protein ABI388_03480 [Bacteroidia bacterium]